MIFIFHSTKYFLQNSGTRRLKSSRLLPTSQTTKTTYRGYIRKNNFCFFVWSQGAGLYFNKAFRLVLHLIQV